MRYAAQLSCSIVLLFFKGVSSSIAQDLTFPGISPSLSFSTGISGKFDFNVLATSKIRTGNLTVKEVNYESQVLEIYTQGLLNYKINHKLQLGLGYGFQRNNPFRSDFRNENRIVQQLLYSFDIGKIKMYNRFRFEERWFKYSDGRQNPGTRSRYQLGIIRQIGKNKTYWQLNDEIYFITSASRNSFISENWIYSGINFLIGRAGRFETGIGYNSVVRNDHRDHTNLFLLQLAWAYTGAHHIEMMHPVMRMHQY